MQCIISSKGEIKVVVLWIKFCMISKFRTNLNIFIQGTIDMQFITYVSCILVIVKQITMNYKNNMYIFVVCRYNPPILMF